MALAVHSTGVLRIDASHDPVPRTLDAGISEVVVDPGVVAVLIDRVSVPSLKVALGEGSRLTHVRLFLDANPAVSSARIQVTQATSSDYQSHVFQMCTADVTQRIDVAMQGEDASCTLNGLYLATGEQRIENHTRIEHFHPRGTSRELYKGILNDEAQTVFDGMILVRREAQKTDSAQTNKNLLLSARARANSTPELQILANDVKCKHGATIGQLDAEQLFYLRSRGITAAEARRLLIDGFAQEMIHALPLADLHDTLTRALAQKFKG